MKTVKKIAYSLLFVLCLTLAACSGEELPEGMEREKLLSEGQWVLLRMLDGDYEAIHQKMREDQRTQVTVDDIRAKVLEQFEDAGVYKQIEDRMTTGQTIQGEQYGVAVLYCEFSEEDVLVRLFFDAQMELVGFTLQQT